MSFRGLWLALILVSSCSFTAQAQIEDEGMGEIDSWGKRYLSAQEQELPITLWQNADPAYLLDLMRGLDPAALTPPERQLLRRVVLSPATRPSGDVSDILMAERAKLALALGETQAAADLAAGIDPELSGIEAEALATDIALAVGREATACRALSEPDRYGLYWLKLRAVCAILADQPDAATLAIEFAAAQGLQDAWFVEAVFAAAADGTNAPKARYESGLDLALSAKAGFEAPDIDAISLRHDLALAGARHNGLTLPDKLRFADQARKAGVLQAERYRALLERALAQEGVSPQTPLEVTLILQNDPGALPEAQAEALSAMFISASESSLASFKEVASFFLPDVRRLVGEPSLWMYQLSFARASLAAGDVELAKQWLDMAEPVEVVPEPELPIELGIDMVPDLVDGEASQVEAEAAEILETDSIEAGSGPVSLLARSEDIAAVESDELAEANAEAVLGEESDERSLVEIEPEPEPEPPVYEAVFLEAIMMLQAETADTEQLKAVEDMLLVAAQTEGERASAAHILTLWSGRGYRLGPQARALIRDVPDAGMRFLPSERAALNLAAEDGAYAEVALSILAQLNGAPETLATEDMALLMQMLSKIGATEVAIEFAREHSRFWQP